MPPSQSTSTCHLMATLWVELGEEESALARTIIRLESPTVFPLERTTIVHVGRDKTGHLWYSLAGRSPPNGWEEGMRLQVSNSGNNGEGAFQFNPNFKSTTKTPVYNPWKIWATFAHVQSGTESLLRLGLLARRGQMTDSVINSLSSRRCRLSATAKENWLLAARVCTAIKDWLQGKDVPMDLGILLLEESEINREYNSRGALRT